MTIRTVCPSCRKVYNLGEALAGKRIPCPQCQQEILVPSVAAAGSVLRTIRTVCPSCRKVYNLGEPLAGKRIPCPQCRQEILVPSVAAASAVPDARAERVQSKPQVVAEPARRAPTERSRPTDSKEDGPRHAKSDRLRNRDEEDRRRGKKSLNNLLPLLLVGGGVAGLVFLALLVAGLFFAFRSTGEPQPAVSQEPAVSQAESQRVEVPAGPVPAQIDPANVAKVKEATVYLRVQLPNGGVAEGSGFFCLEPGIVMTNAHVIGMLRADAAPPANVEVVAHSGETNETKMTGSVLGIDRSNDLAILRVPADALRLPPPLPVDSAAELTETQKIYVFGFPFGAQLGRNITVSESSVSSLRRDKAGVLSQVQVNGGMQPGNSGGPVTDARGVVVGVSVAIIRGTQINFAIPGDFVRQALDGTFAGRELGKLYRDNGMATLPLKLTCLDPLSRVRDVKVEVWSGDPGDSRPAAWQEPPAHPGDGPRQSYPLSARDGAYTVDVPLPPLPPGKVYWLRPVMVNAASATQWDAATPLALDALPILDRKPTLLQFKAPSAAIDRTLKLQSNVTVNVYRGNASAALRTEKMEGDVLESLKPDPRGTGTFIRLTLGKCPFTRQEAGQTLVPPPQAQAILSLYSPTFLVDASHACKERGKRDFQILNPQFRGAVESMYETVCNTYEATTLSVPNRMVQPLESWPAHMPLFVLLEGKRQIRDIHLTCTYEGMQSAPGRHEAFLGLSGEVKGRGDRAALVLGKVKGHALFDVDKGFLTLVHVTVNSEVEVEDKRVRVLVTDENVLRRSEGNSLGIAPATANQPDPRRR